MADSYNTINNNNISINNALIDEDGSHKNSGNTERDVQDHGVNDDSGSDFNDESVIGNVSKLTIFPPQYSGPTKKGHLIFDASFESGNLGRVDYITEYEYDLFIRPDTCNPRFRVWFNFTVENVKSDQRVIFNVVNFSKTKSLYRDGMSPLVKSTSRPNWCRILPKHVYYYRCPDHKKNYVMSFAFCFDREDEVYRFAYSYPYTYTQLQNYLDSIEQKNLPYFSRSLLGYSVQQRRLDLLTITHPDNLKLKKQRVVFISARIHPGETPASYVCQGFIDFMVSSNTIAKLLRDQIVFKIVPMLNPDGVYLGNYRCSLMGFDLNRHWQDPSPWAHPTLFVCKNLLMEYDHSSNYLVDFYIDIHAHSTLMNGFMYGNVYDDPIRHDKHSLFPQLFQQNAEDFSLNNTNFNKDSTKAGTGRRTLGGCLDETAHCYTLEVSFFSYSAPGSSVSTPYDEEGYQRLGRNLAKTFLDYYRMTDVISVNKKLLMDESPQTGNNSSTRNHRDMFDFTTSVSANNITTGSSMMTNRGDDRDQRSSRHISVDKSSSINQLSNLRIRDSKKLL